MATKQIEVHSTTIETVGAGDITVSIEFDGDSIGRVTVQYTDDDEEGQRKKIELRAEVIERIATVVRERRSYGSFHGPERSKEVCSIHGYFERRAEGTTWLCP